MIPHPTQPTIDNTHMPTLIASAVGVTPRKLFRILSGAEKPSKTVNAHLFKLADMLADVKTPKAQKRIIMEELR